MIELGVFETRRFELFTRVGISHVAMTGGYAGQRRTTRGILPEGHSTWTWNGQVNILPRG